MVKETGKLPFKPYSLKGYSASFAVKNISGVSPSPKRSKYIPIGQPTQKQISKEMMEHDWMSYHIARRVAKDHLRKRKRKGR